ncbi:TPA: NADH:ubiquinone oxidoreductase subunit C, partial [Candidatus Marinimicrobia bacterium]|nr:NADH:ubiquinone oxidoreductase subunit C [Candidatus Neomarinimicrobiota bacterium]
MHSNKYTLLFAVIVTVVASLLLASAAPLLKPYPERNEELDLKTNILKSLGLIPGDGLSPEG